MSKPLLNKILSFILISLGFFLFLLFMNLTIAGDTWVYSATYPINPPFHIGGHHPGRHISELLAIIPGQIIAPLLGGGGGHHQPIFSLKNIPLCNQCFINVFTDLCINILCKK